MSCVLQFPEDQHTVREFHEPVVLGTLVTSDDYLGKLMALCQVIFSLLLSHTMSGHYTRMKISPQLAVEYA